MLFPSLFSESKTLDLGVFMLLNWKQTARGNSNIRNKLDCFPQAVM